MSCISDMMATSLAAAVVSLTCKVIKNGLSVFKRGTKLLQNGILHFVFRFSQSSEIALESRVGKLEPTLSRF